MVTDITRRVNRLQLAKEIIKRSLALASLTGTEPPTFSNAEITKAAWAYLAVTRLNTARLEAKLRRLNSQGA